MLLGFPSGPTNFCTNTVKRYISPNDQGFNTFSTDNDMNKTRLMKSSCSMNSISIAHLSLESEYKSRFESARNLEVQSSIKQSVFRMATTNEANVCRIYGSELVDTVKHKKTHHAYEESRMVVQGYNVDKRGLSTRSPTVQRPSRRPLFSLASCKPSLTLYVRDVKQAYVRTETNVRRVIFVRPPTFLNYTKRVLFQIQISLCGVPEAGVRWFRTYHRYHIDCLHMTPSPFDMCFMFTKAALHR